jgi:hypothetical protein
MTCRGDHPSNVFEFAGFEPVVVPIAPPAQHLAEKLHAYARNYGEPSSRAKDLYDMLAIADTLPLPPARELAEACRQTFALRATEWPPPLPPPPTAWAAPGRGLSTTTASGGIRSTTPSPLWRRLAAGDKRWGRAVGRDALGVALNRPHDHERARVSREPKGRKRSHERSHRGMSKSDGRRSTRPQPMDRVDGEPLAAHGLFARTQYAPGRRRWAPWEAVDSWLPA